MEQEKCPVNFCLATVGHDRVIDLLIDAPKARASRAVQHFSATTTATTSTMFAKSCLLLFLADIALGIRIFLHPSQPSLSSSARTLSPTQARAVVSHHLGLEEFESVEDVHGVEWLLHGGEFTGYGESNGLMLTMSEDAARGTCPTCSARARL